MTTPLLLLAACSSPEVDIPEGERTILAPLEPVNLAPPVLPTEDDDTPEVITLTSGFDVQGMHAWTHMRGWIHADVTDTWAALRVPDVMADRRVIDGYVTTDASFRSDVDASYLFTSQMRLPGREFEFDITWLHAASEGEPSEPTTVVATWELTDSPPFLQKIDGSIELEQVEPGLTEIRGIFHMSAFPMGRKEMQQYFRDLHADLRATLDDEPLDTYDD